LGPIEQQRGRQEFPILYTELNHMTISGRHIDEEANVIVDGRRVSGSVQVNADEKIEIELQQLPAVGLHLLQIQNPDGMFSNDFIFHVTEDADAAAELKRRNDEAHVDKRNALAIAVSKNDLGAIKEILASGAKVNARRPESGATPLSDAALLGHLEVARLLIERGANVNAANRDGNTPLHVSAFMCRAEIVQLLLDHGGSLDTKNHRGETPIDVVSSPWNQPLSDFYAGIGSAVGLNVNLERIERERPQIAQLLRDQAEKTKPSPDAARNPEN
jgi:hypothetical protein